MSAVWLAQRHKILLIGAAGSIVVLSLLLYLFYPGFTSATTLQGLLGSDGTYIPHPIDHLREDAEQDFQRALSQKSTTLKDAAARYRARRGRHPPPHFDAWFKFAQGHNAVIVEEFFDHIYDDLEPFWAVPAPKIRLSAARDSASLVSVRGGVVTKTEDFWRINYWTELVQSIIEAAPVPDLDMPVNNMDESRLLVPWEDINAMISTAASEKQAPQNLSSVSNEFSAYDDMRDSEYTPAEWIHDHSEIWNLFQSTCPPDSPARQRLDASSDISTPAAECMPVQYPEGSYEGYVSNWTVATDPCYHPHLRCLHGTFIGPISMANSKQLVPLFGGSKLVRNNEISIPAAMYWGGWQEYSGGEEHGIEWKKKKDGIVWRGVSSGGWNTAETWSHFHRQRFMSMMNGTAVAAAEESNGTSLTFRLPPSELYGVQMAEEGKLGPWISSLSNTGFTELLCYPLEGGCGYAEPYFHVVDGIPMQAQYDYKLLPDIDGNSYSARFRAFLLSTSLPIKSTIYREWHDSRLFPWVHFVPMDNSFADVYGLLEYFLGSPKSEPGHAAHDKVAEKMAKQGQDWASKVLRKEDMQIYMYRLLLEYARVCRDNRAWLGYTDDLQTT